MNGTDWLLLAQGAVADEAPATPSLTAWLFPAVMIFAVFYLLILLPERRKARDKQNLLDSIKKNDRVVTIGGLYGIVTNVKPGENEIVLRIDEDKDVKVRVTKSSIAQVLTAAKPDSAANDGT